MKSINRNRIKSNDEIAVRLFAIFSVAVFCILILIPLIMMISMSFETEDNIIKYGFSILPRDFSLDAYKFLFRDSQIFDAYKVTIFTTVVGTVLSMLLTLTLAYGLARPELKLTTPITFFVYFTMLFSGGLVPTYLLISKYLGMRDDIWVLIIPSLFNAWNMFLMRNFLKSIPDALIESAHIDGANDMQILFKIILPLAVPGIATISLFYALSYWNQWYNAMLYIDNKKLYPLQYLIMNLVRTSDYIKEMSKQTGVAAADLPSNSLKMATTVVAVGPIILLYPFVQKYFTSGLTVGAIKG